ncbi:DNA mismatch repair protein MutS [Thermaurantimonas aggregans]|uniref:DNA mismatch repair protein MutS n=1 Tax=Thermaurantimonas aggregans TaxID=2173829 RepID=A0A401XJM5_9FLAO|nr:DNA mismatch repair protein MutS [Thermaurantimonas aggregans]MCX8148715.1 DNA mismatch repair protein MutS [Thermaurantimonas aggregans]GCD77181.1 DNA mismatch repair protein MutS [Thermaurantimonas aggregans]
MKQYYSIKAKYPDAILLFRIGDFYETFGEDAIKTARALDIVLTKRSNGAAAEVELAGFPHHSLEVYLPRLVRAGYRVAVCDQLEDPKMAKKIVKRGVTELVTPGLALSDNLLPSRSNNFLASIVAGETEIGLALVDISTGEFYYAQGSATDIEKILSSTKPGEILYPKKAFEKLEPLISLVGFQYCLDDWIYRGTYAEEQVLQQFKVSTLKGFGLDQYQAAAVAAGAALHYMREAQQKDLSHISSIQRIGNEDHLWLDRFTFRNLEVFQSLSPDGTCLLDVIDRTHTPMGSRMLKRWVSFPLKNSDKINERLDMVEWFVNHVDSLRQLGEKLSQLIDIERIASKIATQKATPKELMILARSLAVAEEITSLLSVEGAATQRLARRMPHTSGVRQLLLSRLHEDAPVAVNKGNVIKEGVDAQLDELRRLRENAQNFLLDLQQRESASTGISNLKVAFNNVFGYYIEVRNTHKDKVPAHWIRKQTLVNAERYITEELKIFEEKILTAEEKIAAIETQLFSELIEQLMLSLPALQQCARVLAETDIYVALAQLALEMNYARPVLTENTVIDIKAGRHPVIEQKLPPGKDYIPNDVLLDKENCQVMMITGPNMSGKSALLRQTALICLLAQIGSFVPAESATLTPLDRIFVRVGASDNISQGESTFMVEMIETSLILNNISEKSLVLLDEIGRGTSTYDGISIAWSIARYLHDHPHRPFTLFATHYHEMNEMESQFERIKNFSISVKEAKNTIVFLRKLVPGGSEHSFGIHVAQMAGLPALVIQHARQMLEKLEERSKEHTKQMPREIQLSLFQLEDTVLEEIRASLRNLDLNAITPIEALIKLNEIKGVVLKKS